MAARFQGQTAVVTGAAGDIGSAAVRRFAAEGANVVAADVDAGRLSALAEQLTGDGARVVAQPADVRDEAQVAQLFDVARTRFDRVDVFFNNAGVEGDCADIAESDLAVFDRVMAVNVRGVYLGMKYAVRAMQAQRGGTILNTASVAGLSGSAFVSYCASKHAVIGLTRSIAKQQAEHGIRVNAICPSPVRGAMMEAIEHKSGGEEHARVRAALEARIPLGRYASTDDVVNLVCYLCSDEARFITGGVYTVDGGLTA